MYKLKWLDFFFILFYFFFCGGQDLRGERDGLSFVFGMFPMTSRLFELTELDRTTSGSIRDV